MEQKDCYPDELPGEEFPCPDSKQKDCFLGVEFQPPKLAGSVLHLLALNRQPALPKQQDRRPFQPRLALVRQQVRRSHRLRRSRQRLPSTLPVSSVSLQLAWHLEKPRGASWLPVV
jgi:hypothetical protein